MADDAVRCFIAIEMPPPAVDLLARLQTELHSASLQALGSQTTALRLVRPEGIHLTLKFLGSISGSVLGELQSSLARNLADASECLITIGGIGGFPSLSRPRVIWVGVGGDLDRLSDLQRRVEDVTARLGFPTENRAFSPHLTLARVREDLAYADRKILGMAATHIHSTSRVDVRVGAVSLMRSELLRGGARYTRLASIGLQSPIG